MLISNIKDEIAGRFRASGEYVRVGTHIAPAPEQVEEMIKSALLEYQNDFESFFIDKISGKLATENTPLQTRQEKVITNVHSILYWVDKKDILGAPPLNPQNDSQFNHWEIPIQNWWAQNRGKYPMTTIYNKPTLTDDVHIDSNKPKISIIEPNTFATYLPNQKINIKDV